MTLELNREAHFPNLNRGEYQVTSPETARYNCIAWAAGDNASWWAPTAEDYWPAAAPREVSLTSFRAVFESLGYSECSGAELEVGLEKVAIFVKDGTPTHAARQLANGNWTSKLGDWQDIEHRFLDAVSGTAMYGEVAVLFRRPYNPA